MRWVGIVVIFVAVNVGVMLNVSTHEATGQTIHPAHAEDVDWWTMVWTGAQGLSSVIGVPLLIGTVIFAGLAWHAAKASAESAEDALKATREFGVIAHRAYLSMRDYKGSYDASTGKLIFDFCVVNGGSTPAHEVELWHRSSVCTSSEVENLTASIPDEGKFLILQGQQIRYDVIANVETKDQSAFFLGATKVGAVVQVMYRDVFKAPQILTCHMIATMTHPPSGIPEVEVEPCGNDFAT